MADEQDILGSDVTLPPDILQRVMGDVQQYQRQGIQLVPQPTQLPTLDIGRLMQMPPEAAAAVIMERKKQAERNAAADQNKQAQINFSLQQRVRSQQTKEKEAQLLKQRDNAATEFADQWAEAITQNAEATKTLKESQAAYDRLKHFAGAQSDAKNVSSAVPQGKPSPKEGLFYVPFKVNAITTDAAATQFPQTKKTRLEVATSINDEFEKRTKALNDALAEYHKRTAETHDLEKRTKAPGFFISPDHAALIDITTRKKYPLPVQAGPPSPGLSAPVQVAPQQPTTPAPPQANTRPGMGSSLISGLASVGAPIPALINAVLSSRPKRLIYHPETQTFSNQ